MIAGQLEIQLMADVARIKSDMDKAQRVVGDAMGKMDKAAGLVRKAFGALGVGLSVNFFAGIIKSSINAQDELNKMSQRLGISVKSLAGLEHAASLSGVSLSGLQTALKTLSTQVAEGDKRFSALGIQVRGASGALKSSDALMLEIADRFAGMRDGVEKSAIAVELFGRAGLDMIPMLNGGSKAIAQMMAEGQRLNPVTAESARMAEQFNDNMEILGKNLGAIGTAFANRMLPALSAMTNNLIGTAEGFDGVGRAADTTFDYLVKGVGFVGDAFRGFQVLLKTIELGFAAIATGAVQSFGLVIEGYTNLANMIPGIDVDYQNTFFGRLEESVTHNFQQVAKELNDLALREIPSESINRFISTLDNIPPAAGGAAGAVGGLLPPIGEVNEKTAELVRSLALEQTQLRMTGREQAIFNALLDAGEKATSAQRAQIARLAGELYDQEAALRAVEEQEKAAAKAAEDLAKETERATEAMIEDWQKVRQSFGEFFADLVMEGGNAFDALLKSWERTALQIAGSKLFDMGASLLGIDVPGGASASAASPFLAALTKGGSQFLGGLTKGALGTNSMMATGASSLGAGINSAISAIPGWGWAAMATAVAAKFLTKESTPSHNAGFLLQGLPGISGQFATEAFASGLTPTGFSRRTSMADAEQVIDLFRDLDGAIVKLATAAGLIVDVSKVTGLAETGLGSGLFLGAAGEKGKPGMALDAQLQQFASQLIGSLRGQVDDALLDSVLSAGGVDEMISKLEQVLIKEQDVVQQVEDAIEAEKLLAEERLEGYESALGAARDYFEEIAEMQRDLLEEQERALRSHWAEVIRAEEEIHDRRFRLFRSLMEYTASLRLGSLTTLSPAAQLQFAQGQFRNLAGTALNTSLSMSERLAAAEGLQGAADSYLKAGQGYFASSDGYKQIFAEVMQALEGAKFLGTNAEFDPSPWENAMLEELKKLTAEVMKLPPGISQVLAGMMSNLVTQALLAGKSGTQTANIINGLGPNATTAAQKPFQDAYGQDISDAATSAEEAQAALAEIKALGLSEVDTIKLIAEKAQEQGLSASQVGDLLGLSDAQVEANLAKAGIAKFDVGTNYVPYDMPALVHQGERIIPAAENSRLFSDNQKVIEGQSRIISLLERTNSLLMAGAQFEGRQMEENTKAIREVKSAIEQNKQAVGSSKYAA